MMIEILTESARFNATSQRLADQARKISKKGWFSDAKMLETCEQVNREDFKQSPLIRIAKY